MNDLNLSFWLGLLFAFPLAIGANLLTPKFQQWIGLRSTAKAEKQNLRLKKQLKELEILSSEPGRLQTFLLEGVLFITLFSSMLGVVTAILFALGAVFTNYRNIFVQIGQMFVIGSGIVISLECIETLRKSQRARNINQFREKIEKQLTQLQ